MKTSSVKRVVQVAVCSGLLVGGFGAQAADWFGPNVDWKWNTAGNWGTGSVPTLSTDVDLNNAGITESNPLLISDGCAAECAVLRLASNWAVADGRVPAVKLCSGGTLRTGRGVVLSTETQGKSVFILDGGTLINDHATPNTDRIGFSGQGTFRQESGTYRFDGSNGAAHLQLGVYPGSVGTYIMNGGQIERTNDGDSSARVYVGVKGQGKMVVNGGTIDCPLVVGDGESSDGTLEVNDGSIRGNVTVGNQLGAKGTLVLNGGTLDLRMSGNDDDGGHRLRCGYCGTGRFEWNGGALNASRVYIGYNDSSDGSMLVTRTGDDAYLYMLISGVAGSGAITLADNARLSVDWFKVGTASVGKTAVVTIGECAQLTVGTRADLGGLLCNNADAEGFFPVAGRMTLNLRGGDICLTSTTENPQLLIGRQIQGTTDLTGSSAIVRGWGRIMGAAYSDNTVRMQMGLGQIVGDGEGEERLLDLTPVINIKNEVTNPADGTTGWYAVNKGAVHYPRIWFGAGTATHCFGTDKTAEDPDFVNSMKFTVTTSTVGHFRGGLYATDRTDLSLDKLPPHRGVVNVWKLGVFDSTVDGNPVPFSGLSLKIRYDQMKVSATDKLALYRYANGTWTKVGTTTVAESAATHMIVTTKLMDSDSSQTYNAGIIALVKDVSGFAIQIR